MTKEQAGELLEKTAEMLGEHFDAVQILATRHIDAQTHYIARGAGNWYARQGMAHEFINTDINQDVARQIAERLEPRSDDGDDWKKNAY